jgi:hypothetical protein
MPPGSASTSTSTPSSQHPYDPNAYLNVHTEGWEQRLGTDAQNKAKKKSKR